MVVYKMYIYLHTWLRRLTKTVEPLFMVLLLNVIQDEAKLIHSLEMKTLWILGKKQLPLVIKTTFHVEDDFIWSEHSPVPNNEFDNAFKFNEDVVYAATVKFAIPEHATVEQAKSLYENESKTRYMTMLEVLMNKRKKWGGVSIFVRIAISCCAS